MTARHVGATALALVASATISACGAGGALPSPSAQLRHRQAEVLLTTCARGNAPIVACRTFCQDRAAAACRRWRPSPAVVQRKP